MTRYLTVAGSPLDNNCIEQGLKKAILSQKSAFFIKPNQVHASHHALSVINTALEAGANPIEYLVALIEHEELVGLHPDGCKEPELWMPWNYTAQLTDEAKAA